MTSCEGTARASLAVCDFMQCAWLGMARFGLGIIHIIALLVLLENLEAIESRETIPAHGYSNLDDQFGTSHSSFQSLPGSIIYTRHRILKDQT